MRQNILALCCSFLLGVNLFVTAALLVPLDSLAHAYQQRVQEEGIISKTAAKMYPKNLDSVYYNGASVLIPLSAILFWYVLFERKKVQFMLCWGIAITWFVGLLLMNVSS
jgi:hypothetical protein